jgi:hypothetical protein
MGREIRRVPPNWKHPQKEDRYGRMQDQPMYDQHYDDARREWIDGLLAWERGERPEYATKEDGDYWEWQGNPPDRVYYRPWRDEEATWFQLWQTVSEGSPVSPPFATLDELAAHLAEHGDDWDRSRGNGGWGIERAKAFCAEGWAPSMAVIDGRLIEGTALALLHAKEKEQQ